MVKQLRKTRGGELKLTMKTKLKKRGVMKKILEKVKKGKVGKRVRFALTDTVPLLADMDDQPSDQSCEEKESENHEDIPCAQKPKKASKAAKKKAKISKGKSKGREESMEENIWLLDTNAGEAAVENNELSHNSGKVPECDRTEKRIKRSQQEEEEEKVDERRLKRREARRMRRLRCKVKSTDVHCPKQGLHAWIVALL